MRQNEKANLSRAERNAMKASSADSGVRVCGEEIGGGNDYEDQNQAGSEEGRGCPEETADRRCAYRRGTGAGHRVGLAAENDNVRVTLVHVPEADVRKVRTKMGLSQAQFATKFGFPPATLRNWEQGRSRPDAPTRVLLAVIAKHP